VLTTFSTFAVLCGTINQCCHWTFVQHPRNDLVSTKMQAVWQTLTKWCFW